jgi:hypothetical protein
MAIVLSELTCRKGRGHYTVTLRPRGGERVSMQTDGNLGQVMSGMSVLFNAVRVMQHGGRMATPVVTRGPMELDEFRIEPLTVWPYRWRVEMTSGPYTFTANLEPTLEMVLAGFTAAVKFFGMKTGRLVVYPEVTRTMEDAQRLEGTA